ncbi:MAG TPA: SDR family NAD(P)-dependent oxidoreductase [Anaerolineae bacterium]|nr:SDR family NAD(P)-dependent oxidoreductase [Anaerolineae bacterium]HIQ05166.1 SDR family NAD(P)-dependent oxidoreductase [Anaerolineae bacterium]
MRALVTGATGFVGANVVEALNTAGHAVRALRRPSSRLDALLGLEFEPVVGDVLDPDSLQKAMQGCDVVFHVAGVADYWQADRERMYQVNVEGTRYVMEAALAAGVERVVYTSSAAALGIPYRSCPADEGQRFNVPPDHFPYGHTKHLAELEVEKAVCQGLPAVIVNPTVVLGPRDVNQGSAQLITGVYRQLLPFITPGGMNVIDARDMALGHLAAAEKGRVGERYLLGGENLTLRRAAEIVSEVVNVPPPRFTLPRCLIRPLAWLIDLVNSLSPRPLPITGLMLRLGAEDFYYDTRKAEQELGLRHRPFRETVSDTFEWLRTNGYL